MFKNNKDKWNSQTQASENHVVSDMEKEYINTRKHTRMLKTTNSKDTTKSSDKMVVIQNPNSYVSEQFRILRSKIFRLQQNNHLQTIMVTSALPSEGKSFVASNLAVTIAKGVDEYVLLVDADLRRPTLHEYFNLDHEKGFSDVLLHRGKLIDVVHETGFGNLSIVSAGKLPENPSELLSSKRVNLFIELVKSQFNESIIIFDSTPVQLTSESMSLADQVDAIILVVKAGKTQKRLIRNTVKILGREKIIGIVFNHCQTSPTSYHGRYGYYSKRNK